MKYETCIEQQILRFLSRVDFVLSRLSPCFVDSSGVRKKFLSGEGRNCKKDVDQEALNKASYLPTKYYNCR